LSVRKVLGIKAGEIWAFRESTTLPLQRALIVDPGTHYDAHILSQLIDRPSKPHRSGRRSKYPCKWEDLEDYLARHPEAAPRQPLKNPQQAATPYDLNLRDVEFFAVTLPPVAPHPPIAYSVEAAAAAVGYSEATIRLAIQRGELAPRYANSKAIVLHDDLHAWVHSLPSEPPSRH